MKEAIGTRTPRTNDDYGLKSEIEELEIHDFAITRLAAYHWRITHPDYPKFSLEVWPTTKKIMTTHSIGIRKAQHFDKLFTKVMNMLKTHRKFHNL